MFVLHRSYSFFDREVSSSDRVSRDRVSFDGQLDTRLLDNGSPEEMPTLSLICHPMQVHLPDLVA